MFDDATYIHNNIIVEVFVSFAAAEYTVTEDVGMVLLQLERSGPFPVVNVTTIDGTASGERYSTKDISEITSSTKWTLQLTL